MLDLSENIIDFCARELGLATSEVLAIAATAPKRYFVWTIPKRSGGDRIVCHPARELKVIQEIFLSKILNDLPIHDSAMAYTKGRSIKKNAISHLDSRVILKLDFTDFFNNLLVEHWRMYAADYFPHWTPPERHFAEQILFWGAQTYAPKCLAIGAPTSPMISNALMFEIDARLCAFAEAKKLVYTRYADDITFSSKAHLAKEETISEVRTALATAKYTKIRLNDAKTTIVSNRFARRVTGLTLTPDFRISLGRERKRLISAMVHRSLQGKLDHDETKKLSGLLAFSLDVEPTFIESLKKKYGEIPISRLLRWQAG
jgi:RNA-directed DNA polymerase